MSFFRRPALEAPDHLAARGVFLLVLAVYVFTFAGSAEVIDAEVEFQTTSSLARTGGLALEGTPESDAIASAARVATASRLLDLDRLPVQVTDEGVYSWRGVGQALVALPFYALGRVWAIAAPGLEEEIEARAYDGARTSEGLAHFVVGLRNPLLGAATAWLLTLAAMRLGVTRRRAVLAALAYALTTFAWPQARASLSDVQATFFLFLAFHLVLVAREHLDRLQRPPGRVALGIGVALGLAFLTRVAVAPACLVVAGAAEVVMRVGHHRIASSSWTPRGEGGVTPRRALLLAATPVVLSALVFVALNTARFGAPFDSGYGDLAGGGAAREVFRGSAWDGFSGLVLSPGRGLFVMAPLLLLVPFGLHRAWAEGERLVTVSVTLVGAALLAPAILSSSWHGSFTYGPRYLLPALPFLWLFVALAFQRVHRVPLLRVATLLLVTGGAIVAVGGVVVGANSHQDLAAQAAREVFPDEASLGLPEGAPARVIEEARFERTLWDARFAAPFAHWRIFRHRVAGLGEAFPIGEIFYADVGHTIRPSRERYEGFNHFGWREFVRRFGGPALLPIGGVFLVLLFAVVNLARGLDRTAG